MQDTSHQTASAARPSTASKPSLGALAISSSIVLDVSSPTPVQQHSGAAMGLLRDRDICRDLESLPADPLKSLVDVSTLSLAVPEPSDEPTPSRFQRITSSIFLRPSHARCQSQTRFDSEDSSGGEGPNMAPEGNKSPNVETNGSPLNPTLVNASEKNGLCTPFKDLSNKPSKHKLSRPKSIASLASASLVGVLKPAISPNVVAASLQIRNETGWPLKTVQWPTKVKHRGRTTYLLTHFRGNYFDEISIPPASKEMRSPLIDIGLVPQPSRLKSRKSPSGWIYFDLLKPDGYILHMQCFVKLDRSGKVISASVGRFDLDSNNDKPMPSGLLGSAEVSTANHHNLVVYCLTYDQLIHAENTVDDTPLKPLIMVPTKGITLSSYVSHPHVIVSFRAGKDGRYQEGQRSKLGQPDNCAQFTRSEHSLGGIESLLASVCVQHRFHPAPVLHRSVTINPLSGLVSEGDKRLPLASTSETKSIFLPELDLSLAYGFHDSRMGKRHTMYAYVTPDYSTWLGNLIESDSRWLGVPFSRLVLQGSHDSGMFTPLHEGFVQMITKMKLGSDIGNFIIDHGIPFVHALTRVLKTFNIDLDSAICNIANTQKDNFYDQLRSGARFFDFRPGYCFHECLQGERGAVHHQHACVPGYEYKAALVETFRFLARHPKEIAVFELKSDGFMAQATTWAKDATPVFSMIPTRQALSAVVEEAQAEVVCADPAAEFIKVGGPSDLDRPIGTLINEGIRLLIIHRMGEEPEQGWDWIRDDSYDHELYDTDRPQEILTALSETYVRNSVPQSASQTPQGKPSPGTIYQLQATPTKSITDDIVTSLTYSKASSLLVYTKATVDPHTYRWIRERHFVEPGLVVLLNDFVDPVLTEHAIEKSKIRAAFTINSFNP